MKKNILILLVLIVLLSFPSHVKSSTDEVTYSRINLPQGKEVIDVVEDKEKGFICIFYRERIGNSTDYFRMMDCFSK